MTKTSKLAEQLNSLATMSPLQLRECWKNTLKSEPPNVPTSLLRRLVAHQLQIKRHGRLPALVARELNSRANGQNAVQLIAPAHFQIRQGTRFIREWRGQTIEVVALADGFEWQGRIFRSLSEIARVVTGAHWSGPRFFGLRSAANG
jgi:Protein of unknown function (DUF2924)